MTSEQRLFDFGEVFTQSALVEAMLDLVRTASERIDARSPLLVCREPVSARRQPD